MQQIRTAVKHYDKKTLLCQKYFTKLIVLLQIQHLNVYLMFRYFVTAKICFHKNTFFISKNFPISQFLLTIKFSALIYPGKFQISVLNVKTANKSANPTIYFPIVIQNGVIDFRNRQCDSD